MTIKILWSDSEGEYISNKFQSFLKGTESQWPVPTAPQQNETGERKNQHILTTVHALLLDSFVSYLF